MSIEPMRSSEDCESRVFGLEMGSLYTIFGEYMVISYQCLSIITPEASS
jgi:hypothetical protein